MNRIQLDEEAIFHVARAIESPAGRGAYLDQVCGDDPRLRGRVEALVLLYRQEASFLESPAFDCPATLSSSSAAPHSPEEPGEVIGPYSLLEQIGEGGMGVVYVAEQTRPVRRRVALKVIKPGMDTKQVLARFEAERQALALMDHPNIARVHDAGATPSGRPYFVMELVKGIPITDYCDQARLSVRDRLDLFVLVCRAVQHAHQKGIIHRDLKPSNILVTRIDGVAVPKVIDFGIAKSTGAQLTDRSIYTGFAQLVGTPLYMSPEQAELSGVDVDTRSDVYALGVLLYELLTGTTPIERETLSKAAYDEIRRVIREQEPPTPSSRLGALGVTLSAVSANRHCDPRKLGRVVRGELDWIVMKAMEKDRRRRYETANDFAADVMRYLLDESVAACPPSAWYRLRKLARRHRVALTTTALVSAALITGTGVSTWQAVLATRAGLESRRQATLARKAVDEMYTQFAQKVLGGRPHLEPIQREFLEKALAYYQDFADGRADDPKAKFDAAVARGRVGAIQLRLGKFAESEEASRRAIEQLEDLVARFPGRADYLSKLASTCVDLALLKIDLRRLDEADPLLNRSVAIMDELVTRNPADQKARADLARGLGALGHLEVHRRRYAEAEATLRRGRAFYERLRAEQALAPGLRTRLIDIDYNLGYVHQRLGRLPEAEEAYLVALEQLEPLLSEEPTNPNYRHQMAYLRISLAGVQDRAGRGGEASGNRDRALALQESLVNEFPAVHLYGLSLQQIRMDLFLHYCRTDREEEMQRLAPGLVELGERLFRGNPTVPDFRWRLITSLWFVSELHSASPGSPFADPALALRLARRAVELAPDDKGEIRRALGWARYREGDWEGCLSSLEQFDRYAEAGDYFGAMARWQLGDRARARELFDRAEKWLADYEKRWEPGEFPAPVTMRRIRAEAAALLEVKPTRVEVEPKPAPATKGPAE